MRITGNTRYGRLGRFAAAGAVAGALLLTGCGSDDGGGGDRADRAGQGERGDKGTRPAPGKATVLTAEQVTAVMPREADLPGWGGSTSGEPVAVDLRTQDMAPVSCVNKKDPICEGALFASGTMFARGDAGTLAFSVYAYEDAAAATTASRALLDRHAQGSLDPRDTVTSPLPGVIGESSAAKRGKSKLRSQGSVVMSQVGTTVLVIETGGLNAKIYTGDELMAVGKVIAERSRQVQNGERPTAKLKDGALDYRKIGDS
ncbi:hypothetical protein ACFYT4_07300 [Streptomyces sp. NPDC004609]|uniref:hypothetical protein n=1 Tax=Streptomyces sp. NPDC004609 TaxID=3364704 RepID=UPI0036A77C2E